LSLVVPLTKVGDEAVHKELGDRMERAATTASSFNTEQDSGSGPSSKETVRFIDKVSSSQEETSYSSSSFRFRSFSPKELSKEDLKEMLEIVPVEETKAEALQVKVGNITEAYEGFKDMLKGFDREDLDTLWSFVKGRFRPAEPSEDMEKALWVKLKRLFELDKDDVLWKLQRYMHDPLTWRLYGSSEVHHVSSTRRQDIFKLDEKDYPLTKGLAILMLSNKLRVDQQS
ncbi:hypothetical protein Tco_1560546, partial [Tanacetum coccineum]